MRGRGQTETGWDWWELASLVQRGPGTGTLGRRAGAGQGCLSLPPDTRAGVRWPSVGSNKQSHPPSSGNIVKYVRGELFASLYGEKLQQLCKDQW